MKSAYAIVAALLAGCGSAPQGYRDGKDAFGQAFTWEWRNQNAPAAAAVSAKPPNAVSKERQDFEAWQEWKRKNQK